MNLKISTILRDISFDHKLGALLSTIVQDTCSILNSNAFNDDPTQYTSPRKMRYLIKTLKSGKALDCDGEPNICLKNIPRRAAVFLTYIFNSSLMLFFKSVETRYCASNSETWQRSLRVVELSPNQLP
jgi:hypothetical protein